jgi:formylglycine-generating enzyme required for sulfatase activity
MTDTKKSRDDDYLGYGVYADTLWARIETALDKDADGKAELGDDPLVVGIFGEWGAGKSKLLDLVLQRAKDLAKQREFNRSHYDAGYGLTVPVYFQPWKYEHEPHLLVPLVLHILAALNETLKRGQTPYEGATEKAGAAWKKVMGALPSVVSGFEKLLDGAEDALGIPEPTGAGIAVAFAAKLASLRDKPKEVEPVVKKSLRYHGDGRFYYEIHEHLKHVTRPKKHAPIRNGVKIDADIRINFVVFIDDLDRCLPEKAVSTLEMIKTIFNVDSFAFVLALDEEVVERGIGHRYRDYSFKGKKPEMPITGFEYLEKIVHLPFRLPAITAEQAEKFIREYEGRLEPDANRRWFSPAESPQPLKAIDDEAHNHLTRSGRNFDLMPLVLSSFHAYVPRKLIRLVELMHQTASVADARDRPLLRTLGSFPDPRVVLTFVLIQLFQPELFRLLRRRYDALSQLISGYATKADASSSEPPKKPLFTLSDVSDIDLWAWVGEGSKIRCASDASAANDDVTDPIGRIQAIADPDNRARAQQVRLPLVEHLVEFRSTQRHAFDVMRLLHSLHREMGVQALEIEAKRYFSLLGKVDELPTIYAQSDTVLGTATASGTIQVSIAENAGSVSAIATVEERMTDARPIQPVRDVAQLFADWRSDQQPVQANLAGNNNLQAGFVLAQVDSLMLLGLAQVWLGEDATLRSRQILLRGLQYLAPFIARDYSPEFWNLVKDALPEAEQDFSKEITDLAMLKRRELWADVRSTLGADDRFDRTTRFSEVKSDDQVKAPGTKLYLFRGDSKPSGSNPQDEPIPGFFRVKQLDQFVTTFHIEDATARPTVLEDFFVSRTLTTVDQYAAFIEDGGYDCNKNDFWDDQAKAWLNGESVFIKVGHDSNSVDVKFNEPRDCPFFWTVQRTHGSRAVYGVNWFEARAYARWLDKKLRDRIVSKFPPENKNRSYRIALPTSAQRERVARAATENSADGRDFPWGSLALESGLRANIRGSNIGRASVVGLFPANILGVFDLAGNLAEWQANRFDADQKDANVSFPKKKSFEPKDRIAILGGNWEAPASSARTSARDRQPPGIASNTVGFRLVLTQTGIRA